MTLSPNASNDIRLAALEAQWQEARGAISSVWEDRDGQTTPGPSLTDIETEILRTRAQTPFGLAVKVRLLNCYSRDRDSGSPIPELIESLSHDLREWM